MENIMKLNIEYCKNIVDNTLPILSYSHIPTAIIALVVGFVIFNKNKDLLLGKVLVLIAILFSVWSFLDLSIWYNYNNPKLLMFSWSVIEIFSVSIFLLSFYFFYIFASGKDLRFRFKLILATILSSVIFISLSSSNLQNFNLNECVATENDIYSNYINYIKIIMSGVIVIFSLYNIIITKEEIRKQVSILSVGLLFFILSFFASGYISDSTGNYIYESYGLFGITIFFGSMAYIIIKFKALNLKIVSINALVLVLLFLTGSQLLLFENKLNLIINIITFMLVCIFSYFIIQSVKEIESKNEKLKGLDKLKNEFISMATHQLRGPITAIKGYLSLFLEGIYKAPPAELKVIGDVFQSAQNMANIVNDFLNIANIERGVMKYNVIEFDFRDIFRTNFYEYTLLLKGRPELKLEMNIEGDGEESYLLRADSGKYKQVISNLIDNAIKYTPKGTIKMNLRKLQNGWIEMRVKDTGIGVEKDVLPLLFTKFKRSKEAEVVNTTGTGLGLYVVRSMVESQGGVVKVESDGLGFGSTFILEVRSLTSEEEKTLRDQEKNISENENENRKK